ncbi:MAG: CooT family nickel-binding protein [Desulfobacteraceae bacterium]|nr:CooT family nickel-binding protein [Desulfobacteraceae bacterium]
MCEANAYLIKDNKEVLLMEAVDKVEPEDDGVCLRSIFGEQQFIKGYVYSLSLVDHKVYLKEKKE